MKKLMTVFSSFLRECLTLPDFERRVMSYLLEAAAKELREGSSHASN
jgi:hypothetical protein